MALKISIKQASNELAKFLAEEVDGRTSFIRRKWSWNKTSYKGSWNGGFQGLDFRCVNY